MPNLQRCCGVHPVHPVDTCHGAVKFLTGAEPLGALWALVGSGVEGAAMCATVIPRLTDYETNATTDCAIAAEAEADGRWEEELMSWWSLLVRIERDPLNT